jgi:hypothetical protein
VHGNEAGFVEVDCKAGCRSEIIEDFLEMEDCSGASPTKDKSVIGVLEYRAREI